MKNTVKNAVAKAKKPNITIYAVDFEIVTSHAQHPCHSCTLSEKKFANLLASNKRLANWTFFTSEETENELHIYMSEDDVCECIYEALKWVKGFVSLK